jgi:hypothetical protein
MSRFDVAKCQHLIKKTKGVREMQKLCPMAYGQPELIPCRKEACAWWNLMSKQCAMWTMSNVTSSVNFLCENLTDAIKSNTARDEN